MINFFFKSNLLAILLSLSFSAKAQSLYQPYDSSLIHHVSTIDHLIQNGFQENLFPGISAVLFQNDSLVYFNYGLAKIESKTETTEQIKYQLGSVGKLLTAIAVLQQVDKGQLDLHTDINEYLGASTLEFSFTDQPVTLHCLLTHSCGFNDINIGYMAKDLNAVLPLETYIQQSNPDLFQAPGSDINYSNYSYALAGLIVEKVSGTSFENYIKANIFNILGMSQSSLRFPEGYEQHNRYANAYVSKEEGFDLTQIYPRHAIPAGSLVATSEDMGQFIQALFKRNNNLLSNKSWNLFYQLQFSNHPLLNGYTYGMEQQNINGVQAWAKGGMLPGALSNVLIVPGEFAFFSVVNTNDDLFGEYFFKNLFDTIHPDTVELKPGLAKSSVEKYTGEYRDKRYNRNAAENVISLFRGAFTIYNNATADTLVAYHNGQFHNYVQVEEDVFQNTELPYEFFVFEKNDKGQIVALYRNLNIGGLSIPVSLEKTNWYNSPTFVNEHYAVILLIIFSGILFMFGSLLIRLIRLVRKDFWEHWLIPGWLLLLFSSIIILIHAHSYYGPLYLVKNSKEFLLGYPPIFTASTMIGYWAVLLTGCYAISLIIMWRKKYSTLLTRLYLTIIGFAVFIHLGFLYYWSFL